MPTHLLKQRTWMLFAIAVIACGIYFGVIEYAPEPIRVYLKALPLVWAIPGVFCSAVFIIAWRKNATLSSRLYLRSVAYGFAAPPLAMVIVAVIYTQVFGGNP